MKLTAAQKQFWVPLATFVVSASLFASLLGSIWALITVPSLALSAGVFGLYNFARLTKSLRDWMDRDD